MNIAYPISEILKCVEIINQPKNKFYKNSDKTSNLNNTASMKKKIIQTQGAFGETIETRGVDACEVVMSKSVECNQNDVVTVDDLGMI